MNTYSKKNVLAAIIVVIATLGSAFGVAAQNNIGNAIIGAIIDNAIESGNEQNAANTAAVIAAANAAAAQRVENRNVQTALNYFNFNAGVPDGVFGRRTRTAVSQFQAFMSFPVTGGLTTFEKDFLLSSYNRALAGGSFTSNTVLNDPNGTRGLLLAYMGTPNNSGGGLGNGTLGNSLSGAANDFGSNTQDTAGQLPVFTTAPQEPSMADLCAAGLTSAVTVQSEFCNLRSYAISDGDRLAATVQGASAADISAQCLGFAPTMAAYAASAGIISSFNLIDDLHGWSASTGVAPSSLEGIGKVCLGVGYSSDNSELALASLLALIGLDQPGYSELLGYHLAFGFGFGGAENKASGAEWLDTASLAFASGETGLNGQNGATRAILASSMAGQLRGIPVFGVTLEANPVSEDSNVGFFTPVSE